jgi:hypothetical protein
VPDCDYCSATFEDEDAYLDHLAGNHEDQLGPIERRRVAEREADSSGVSRTAIVVGAVAVLALGAFVATFVLGGNGGNDVSPEGIEASALDDSGASQYIDTVEQFPSQGNQHVSGDVDYARMPPLSGPHSPRAQSAKFAEQTPPLPELVHSLEHGHVVVYYDEAALTPEARQSLQQFVQAHSGTWQSVIAVPNPSENPESPFVLTAWRHRLTMDSYDAQAVHAFLSEFLGRGPENPVR